MNLNKNRDALTVEYVSKVLAYAKKVASYIWDSGDRYGIWDKYIDVISHCEQGIATDKEWELITYLYSHRIEGIAYAQ